jgi:hypothetical protein
MTHDHIVLDTDPHFIIDPVTRALTTESQKIQLIQGDHNSERFTFELPRTVDGHDMALCNKVRVHYINVDKRTKEQSADVYEVDDFQVSPTDETKVIGTWLISGNATKYAGSLSFVVEFACIPADKVEYSWHTAIYTGVSISDGINNGEAVVTEYADVLEAWHQQLIADSETGVNAINEAKEAAIREVKAAGGAVVVQTTGDSEAAVMSQKAVTENFDKIRTAGKDNVNLFNIDNIAEGQINYAGNIVDLNSYIHSDHIPIEAGKQYSFPFLKSEYGDAGRFVHLYDANKNWVRRIGGVEDASQSIKHGRYTWNIVTVTIPADSTEKFMVVNGVRLTQYDGIMSVYMVVEGKVYPERYYAYGEGIPPAIKPDVYVEADKVKDATSTSPLLGKSITLNGDSLCATPNGGYGKIIADRYKMTYQNIAVGGGTITAEQYSGETARHWISRTISNMNAEADYAILEGGVNDASLQVPMGTLTDGYNATLDDTTFYGAFESMLKQLLIRFAGKKVGYIAVHKMTNNFRSTDDPNANTSYYWAAKKCCEKWGVPFLDLNSMVPAFGYFTESGDANLYALRTAYTQSGDGWHPTKEGFEKYYRDKIVSWLETL